MVTTTRLKYNIDTRLGALSTRTLERDEENLQNDPKGQMIIFIIYNHI